MIHTTDLDLTAKQVAELASLDAVVGFLAKLGYDTGARTPLTPESLGLTGESAGSFKKIELLSEDPEHFLRVVFAQPKSLTAKARNDLARVLGRSNIDHLLVFASDFDTLEFVLLDKRKREAKGPVAVERIQVVPKTVSLSRRSPTRLDLRTLRRFTWTCRDGLEQYDKLRSVFDAAVYTGEYFQNRALFADYYLRDRLKDDAAWQDNPSATFEFVRDLLKSAQADFSGKDKDALRKGLFESLFKKLGFKPNVNRPSKTEQTQPDYLLKDANGVVVSAAFVYPWDRWLDGPDLHDQDTPEENPGACVVTALDQGQASWIVVTNGKLWRLYGRQAHARATNFYEVDLVEALSASGDTDPNEAFRYWWLFFRLEAFLLEPEAQQCWLDTILRGSRDYAKRLGDRLKDRIFVTIFPYLAQGFLEDRRQRLGLKKEPSEEELADVFEATLTLLYRLLFLLYAESRDLLPVREAPYFAASLKKIKEEIAEKAGVAEADVPDRLKKAYSATETGFYDRMGRLFRAMDKGDPVLNVPTYNGGLFTTTPDESDRRDQHIARFLLEYKVPDRYFTMAIDRLSRDQDEHTLALGFIDYKSLEVRHLGSIYEGLLEFKLKVAEEDLTTQASKNSEKYIPLLQAKPKRGKQADVVVRKREVYLSNDKAERKATGSYYTPDNIVEYIVANTVGPVLDEKLESLRSDFRKVRKTFENELQKAQAYPPAEVRSGKMDHRQWAGVQTYNHHKELVERMFDLKVLDPATGSGHFLVETVDFVTDRLLNFLNQFPINPVNFALDRTRTSILESLGEQGVTVDPAKLTDINLLKRHVLKRCIYGVDINPMAVELAKVSLWLDAFTLGAPLSFLDHHLRCGNSLVGATFKDLESATKATANRGAAMFGIDYEPLMRAINHVLFVSKMADATAAEVTTSASRYDQARQLLAGYQVILDFLVAPYFGLPIAADFVQFGSQLDLTDRQRFYASLHDDKERSVVAQVEALAQQPDHRFFHWDIEFPEVFFGFSDADQRQIAHKDKIREGSAGFDCVVGNPPYVRQEALKGLKPYLANEFDCYHAIADLFAYFFDRACGVTRQGGCVGFITSGSWMKANFGGPLRASLAKRMRLQSVIDFGEWQPFPGAEMIRPSVVVLQRDGNTANARVFRFLTNGDPPADLSAAVAASPKIDTSCLGASEWRLEGAGVSAIFDKMLAAGVTLGDYTNRQVYRGVITGLTEAFVIHGDTRAKAIGQHRCSSSEVIKPYLEGKNLRSWFTEESDRWLVVLPKGFTQSAIGNVSLAKAEKWLEATYPGLHDWLHQFKDAASKRQDVGDYWWELRACDYYDTFEQPKIVWPDISKLPRFSMDVGNHFLGNTGYMIPLEDYFLLGVLSSWPTWFMISRICQPLRLRAGRWQYRLFRQFMEKLPIPKQISTADRDAIAGLARRCNQLGPKCYRLECEVMKSISSQLVPADKDIPQALEQWWKCSFSSFKEIVETLRRSQLAGRAASDWEERHKKETTARQAIRSEIESAEAELSERVARAFGLSQAEFSAVMEAVSS